MQYNTKIKANKTREKRADHERHAVRSARFRKEIVGIFLGIGAALIVGALVPAVNENYSLGIVVLWGGAIGGFLASYERFEQAGAMLTRSENRALNLLIGAGLPIGLLVIVFLWGANRA